LMRSLAFIDISVSWTIFSWVLWWRRVDGEIRVGLFAIRDIKHGEALTYDYK
jgi:hypothetical protein